MTEAETLFLHQVAQPAMDTERTWTIPAAITVAQAIIESSWGKSTLFTRANNPFGIKFSHKSGVEPYGELDLKTHEYINGEYQIEEAGFQKYKSLGEAFQSHARLLHFPRYAPFLALCPSTRAGQGGLSATSGALQNACAALGPKNTLPDGQPDPGDHTHCGYSTNPRYGELLMELIREFHLDDPKALARHAALPVAIDPDITV